MRILTTGLILAALLAAAGCAGVSIEARGGVSTGAPTGPAAAPSSEPVPPEKLGVPRGHLPPPGECRVWHPGDPPGHQPAPGKCDDLSGRVGPGDWLLYRPSTREEVVEVTAYDRSSPGVRIAIWIYDFKSGRYLRDG